MNSINPNGKIISIIGTRGRNSLRDQRNVLNVFNNTYEPGDWICSGGCPKGGDRFAEALAKDKGIPILICYPNWKKYGKSAGFVRNTDVATFSDKLIAIVAGDRKGGTEDTLEKFKKLHPEGMFYLV